MSDPLHRIFEMLGEIKADNASMKEDILEIKAGVADYQKTKNKILGWCIGISTATGAGVTTILNKLGITL